MFLSPHDYAEILSIFPGTCDPKSNDMKYPVLLMESVQKIAQDFQTLLTDKDKKKLAGYVQKLGFDDVADTFCVLQPETGKRVNFLFIFIHRFNVKRRKLVSCGFVLVTFHHGAKFCDKKTVENQNVRHG